jgi:phenylacetic acid degradation operon negative regulatory protein
MIRDYRRIILRDPMLPPELLPGDWIGGDAYALARAVYHGLAAVGEGWIDGNFHGESGPLPAPDAASGERFPPYVTEKR